MKAIILAGGKGKRLRPLTWTTPKPMLPILNKPTMLYTIELLRKYGITEIGITVGYLANKIKRIFGDGSHYGVKLTYFEEDEPLGTAGSLQLAEDFLTESFVVVSGDVITNASLYDALEFHKRKQALFTIVTKEVSNPVAYGLTYTNKDGKVIHYIEKPGWDEVYANTINTGIYVCEPEIVRMIKGKSFFDFSHHLIPYLLDLKENVYAFEIKEYWMDIGKVSDYRTAQFDMLDNQLMLENVYYEKSNGIWVGKDVVIEEGAYLQPPVLIGNNTIVRSGSIIGPYAVIGNHSFVGTYSRVIHSIVMDYVYIGHNAELRGTIVSDHVSLHEGSILSDESIIGDEVTIGKGAVVKSRVKIWPEKKIEDNRLVESNIVWGDNKKFPFIKSGSLIGKPYIEMSPEGICKIAHAYMQIIKDYRIVSVGTSSHPLSQSVGRMFTNVLNYYGVDVLQLEAFTDVFSNFIAKENIPGVYMYVSPTQEQTIHIRLLHGNGESWNVNESRVLEGYLEGYDTGTVFTTEIGKVKEKKLKSDHYVQEALHVLGGKKLHSLVSVNLEGIYTSDFRDVLQEALSQMDIHLREKETIHSDLILRVNEDEQEYSLYNRDGDSVYYFHTHFKERTEKGMVIENHLLYQVLKGIIHYMRHVPNHQWKAPYYIEKEDIHCRWEDYSHIMKSITMNDTAQFLDDSSCGASIQYENGDYVRIVTHDHEPKITLFAKSNEPLEAKRYVRELIERIRVALKKV